MKLFYTKRCDCFSIWSWIIHDWAAYDKEGRHSCWRLFGITWDTANQRG